MSIRHALLALLAEGPKYGLQLREEFESRTGEVWPLNVGQVYTTLQRLERDGLVESDGDAEGPQKSFHLTEGGAGELAEWLRTPPDLSAPPRDELVIKVLVAIRLPGVDVHEVIQAHRRYLVELMQQWTRLKTDEADFDLSLALVVDVLDGEHFLIRRRAEGERANGEPLDGAGMPGLGVGAGKPFGEALDGPGHGNTVPVGHLDAEAEGGVADFGLVGAAPMPAA